MKGRETIKINQVFRNPNKTAEIILEQEKEMDTLRREIENADELAEDEKLLILFGPSIGVRNPHSRNTTLQVISDIFTRANWSQLDENTENIPKNLICFEEIDGKKRVVITTTLFNNQPCVPLYHLNTALTKHL